MMRSFDPVGKGFVLAVSLANTSPAPKKAASRLAM